jgi:nucleotide-binding universal stress UspA family protein
MVEYERILLPVAGNGDVEPVVGHARAFAEAFDAELVALHVVDPDTAGEVGSAGTTSAEMSPPDAADGADGSLTDPRSPTAVFDAVADGVGDGVSLERVTTEGDPGDAIVSQVREQDCDLVVMGTHNRQGLDRLVTGSVAEHVGQATSVPVTTINVGE